MSMATTGSLTMLLLFMAEPPFSKLVKATKNHSVFHGMVWVSSSHGLGCSERKLRIFQPTRAVLTLRTLFSCCLAIQCYLKYVFRAPSMNCGCLILKSLTPRQRSYSRHILFDLSDVTVGQ